MLQGIFSRAQSAINETLADAAGKALMAVPFVLAIGFAIAALYLRIAREYGAETATMVMALLWLTIGIAISAILALRRAHAAPSDTSDREAEIESETASGSTASSAASFTTAERDLLLAALTSAAPIALPQLLRILLRNLPLLAAIGAAIFVLTRSGDEGEAAGSAAVAAE